MHSRIGIKAILKIAGHTSHLIGAQFQIQQTGITGPLQEILILIQARLVQRHQTTHPQRQIMAQVTLFIRDQKAGSITSTVTVTRHMYLNGRTIRFLIKKI